jgi:hypothetical protein
MLPYLPQVILEELGNASSEQLELRPIVLALCAPHHPDRRLRQQRIEAAATGDIYVPLRDLNTCSTAGGKRPWNHPITPSAWAVGVGGTSRPSALQF